MNETSIETHVAFVMERQWYRVLIEYAAIERKRLAFFQKQLKAVTLTQMDLQPPDGEPDNYRPNRTLPASSHAKASIRTLKPRSFIHRRTSG